MSDVAVSDEKAKKKQMRVLYLHCTANMMVSMFTFMTRAEVLLPLVGGSFDRVAVYMSGWTSATALLEFLVNPTIGQLSDYYGRRIFLLLAPYANLILKSWVILNPSIVSLTVERMICDGLRTLAGSTMGMAMMSDLVDRSQLAQAGANMSVCMGIGLLISPVVSSFLSPIGTYKAALVMAAVQLAIDTMMLKESLPADQRKTTWGITNPFAFTRLFTTKGKHGTQLRKLSTVTMLHNMIDIKVTADPILIFQQATLGWTRSFTQRFQGVMGLALLFQGKVTKKSLSTFGIYGHTTFTHSVQVLRAALLGFFPYPWMMWLNGVMGWITGSKEHAVKQLLTGSAVDAGFGAPETMHD